MSTRQARRSATPSPLVAARARRRKRSDTTHRAPPGTVSTPPEAPSQPAVTPSTVPRWVTYVVLAVLTALPFVNAAPDALLVDDASFPPEPSSTLSLDSIVQYFREDAWASVRIITGVYRPISLSLTRLESLLWDTAPRGYHVTSILVHVATTLVLYGFLAEVLRRSAGEDLSEMVTRGAAWVAALVFGVHPIHTEAVDSIFNRAEVLATLGVVGALWLFVREVDRRPRRAWVGACVLYFVALLCKESAVTLPVMLALVMVLVRGEVPLTRQRFVPLAWLLIPLVLYAILRTSALGLGGSVVHQQGGLATGNGLGSRIELTITALRDFLRMMVWPSPLRVSYDDYVAHGVISAIAGHVALAGAALALWRRAPGVGVGLAIFDIALLPSTRLISHLGVVVTLAERYAYLPSIGCALALGAGLLMAGRRYGPWVYLAVGAALYLVLAPLTYERNEAWHSEVALWEADTTVAPENLDAWKWLTAAYMNVGRWGDIMQICDHHLPTHGENPGLAIHCSMTYDAEHRPADAELALRRAMAAGPNSHVSLQLARHLAGVGQIDEARRRYEEAIALEPDAVRKHTLRGEMLLTVYQGRRTEAEDAYAAALAIEPRYDAARSGLQRARAGQ